MEQRSERSQKDVCSGQAISVVWASARPAAATLSAATLSRKRQGKKTADLDQYSVPYQVPEICDNGPNWPAPGQSDGFIYRLSLKIADI